jgi:hypothetical protein
VDWVRITGRLFMSEKGNSVDWVRITRRLFRSENGNLIENILQLELEMFLNVRSRYPVSCQENPDAFRFHRGAGFSMWSEETLQSYLDDLTKAKEQNQNLMTLKYARMENIIPTLKTNPVIDEIVQMEVEAQREMFSRYPNIMSQVRPLEDDCTGETSFKTYLRGELETYSDRTLELLCRDIRRVRDRGENWMQQLYANLFKNLGYESLDETEKVVREKNVRP